MADPTIQTFCCHSASNRSQDGDLLFEFNTPAYNIVCAVSSVIGVFGAIFQVINASYVCNIAIQLQSIMLKYLYIFSFFRAASAKRGTASRSGSMGVISNYERSENYYVAGAGGFAGFPWSFCQIDALDQQPNIDSLCWK